jgi:hypothetical protein
MEGIIIVEVADTNLLQITSDQNRDATWYTKTNMTVRSENDLVIITNNGATIISEPTENFKNPYYPGSVDLAEVIQGYLLNLIPENQEEVNTLKSILSVTEDNNELLEIIRNQTEVQDEMLVELQACHKYLRKIYNPE